MPSFLYVICRTPISVYVILSAQQIQNCLQLNVNPFHKLNQRVNDTATAWRVGLGWVVSSHNTWQTKPVNATIPFSPDLLYKGRDTPRHYYEAVYNNSEVALHTFDPTQLFVCGTRVAVRVPEIFRRLPKTWRSVAGGSNLFPSFAAQPLHFPRLKRKMHYGWWRERESRGERGNKGRWAGHSCQRNLTETSSLPPAALPHRNNPRLWFSSASLFSCSLQFSLASVFVATSILSTKLN